MSRNELKNGEIMSKFKIIKSVYWVRVLVLIVLLCCICFCLVLLSKLNSAQIQLNIVIADTDIALSQLRSIESQLDNIIATTGVALSSFNSIEVTLDNTSADADVGDRDSGVTIPDDVFVPEGARICGLCTGCGEFHFLWDVEYHGHIHDDNCEHDYDLHNHIHNDGCEHD